MSALSLFRISKALYLASVWVFLTACADAAQPASVWSKPDIVKRYSNASAEDRSVAQSLAEQARKRLAADPSAVQNNTGPLIKLWCEAAMIAPNPENLAQCAQFHFNAVEQMSKPQPSKEAARLQHAKDSLAMIDAAAEIAAYTHKIDDSLDRRLKTDALIYREVIAKGAKE